MVEQFKVGDLVTANIPWSLYHGKVGVVKEVSTNGKVLVDVEDHGRCLFLSSWLMATDKPAGEQTSKPAFEVGDRVRVNAPCSFHHCKCGVVKVCDNGRVFISLEGHQGVSWFSPEDLMPADKQIEFKVGDWVNLPGWSGPKQVERLDEEGYPVVTETYSSLMGIGIRSTMLTKVPAPANQSASESACSRHEDKPAQDGPLQAADRERTIGVGDVVELKSGGPDMTVGRVGKDGTIECYWFDDDNKRNHSSFPLAALQRSPGYDE